MPQPMRTPFSRVFLIEDTAGPANAPDYRGRARALGVSWPQGDISPVEVPSEGSYDRFDTVDVIRGQRGLPTLGLQFQMQTTLSDVLSLVRKECAFDVQVHTGVCEDPTDFDLGYEKIMVLERARPSDYTTGDLGALGSDQNAVVNEDVPMTGLDYYELKKIVGEEGAAAEVTDEVVDVVICDSKTCGECGLSSDGCQVAFALTGPVAGSPGLPSELLYTNDGGTTWAATSISTLGLGEAATAMACVGTNLVVISYTGDNIHYAPIADILNGTEAWTATAVGIVAAGSPLDIFSLGRTKTWICGDGGYVYFSDDITAGVTAQQAGDLTSQNLNSIHGLDKNRLATVGDANAMLVSNNGGEVWTTVTGPAAATILNVVSFRPDASGDEMWVGDAAGALWYTINGGVSWVAKALPGTQTNIDDISWSNHTVGYLSDRVAGPAGRVLRTISGGNSWVVTPESTTFTFPANDQINALAACTEDPNVVFAGGLADDASDGILVKLA